jgi:hypothetical protein
VIEIEAPANGATYEFASAVPAQYRCADAGSGVAAAKCRGPVASGDPVDTRIPGVRSFTVTAVDAAGNRSTATSRYTVVWPFRGFLAPIANRSW